LLEREKKVAQLLLYEYAENVTKEAIENLDPVIGREKEIDDVIAVLARRTQLVNLVLVKQPLLKD
jgi:ATP-dependent Clp protease ATP-binding subunit ClpA